MVRLANNPSFLEKNTNGLSTAGVTYQDASGTHTAVLNTTTVFDNGVVDTLGIGPRSGVVRRGKGVP